MATSIDLVARHGSTFVSAWINATSDNGSSFSVNSCSFMSTCRRDMMSANSANLTILGNASSNQVQLSMTANITGNLSPNVYVFDVLATDSGGNVTTIVEGRLYMKPSATVPYFNLA